MNWPENSIVLEQQSQNSRKWAFYEENEVRIILYIYMYILK